MYRSACGSPITPGLSFCNRCGMSLKERSAELKSSVPVVALILAMVLVAGGIYGPAAGWADRSETGRTIWRRADSALHVSDFFDHGFYRDLSYRQLGRLTAQPKLPVAQPVALWLRHRLIITPRSRVRSQNHCPALPRTRRAL